MQQCQFYFLSNIIIAFWSWLMVHAKSFLHWQDSNPRPLGSELSTLTTRPRLIVIFCFFLWTSYQIFFLFRPNEMFDSHLLEFLFWHSEKALDRRCTGRRPAWCRTASRCRGWRAWGRRWSPRHSETEIDSSLRWTRWKQDLFRSQTEIKKIQI